MAYSAWGDWWWLVSCVTAIGESACLPIEAATSQVLHGISMVFPIINPKAISIIARISGFDVKSTVWLVRSQVSPWHPCLVSIIYRLNGR